MENYVPLVSNVGFPIFVATYILMRLEKTINRNSAVIGELCLKLKNYNGR